MWRCVFPDAAARCPATRSWDLSPGAGGVSIHRTDCINIINLPESERIRLIDAEWQQPESENSKETYSTEIQIFANNRIGMFVDISKVFTERQIDITSMNVRTSKQGRLPLS